MATPERRREMHTPRLTPPDSAPHADAMGPIRPHKKSRTGCKTCRGRRVKCDEVHPVCTNCQRREIQCVYDTKTAASAPTAVARIEVQSLLSDPSPPPSSPAPPQAIVKHNLPPAYAFLHLFSNTLLPSPSPSPGVDLTRLELLHQYSTSTFTSFTNHAPWLVVWRDTVPQLAFTYPFVLHAVLAISALHLSFLNAERSEHYQVLAARYYHDASVALRNALPRRAALEGNALFVASSFIAIYVFACPTVVRHGNEPRALTWFPVLRGIQAVIHGQWNNVAEELAPSLRGAQRYLPDGVSLPPLPASLDRLSEGVADSEEQRLYDDALVKLKRAWEIYRATSTEFWVAAAFMWPVTVSEGFVQLLMERRPRALVLLAHYGAMFSKLGGFWWIGGRAREELAVIEGLVGDKWSETWLGWVRDVVDSGMLGVKS